MAERNYKASDIVGLSPSVEATRSDQLFVLNGRNYVFDSRGPRSVFGNRCLLPQPLGAPAHTQGFRLKLEEVDRCFTFTSDSILEWDEVKGGWSVLYVISETEQAPSRWTWGYLNGYLYVCHPRTGILVYNLDTGIFARHADIGIGTPDDALYVTVDNGLLVVVTPIVMAWSNPSNGLDFTPQLGGAGFQVISDRVSGFPVMVSSYNRGCLTWTTGGVMRSEFTGDASVYRHRAMQTEYRPVNSFCTAKLDDSTILILDERGIFQSRGEAPTPLTPLFNEFLAQYLQENNLKVGSNVRLEWDELQRRLYLSVSLSVADPLYEDCFVLYPNLDKWGQFNEPHYGIIPLIIQSTQRADDYYGFVDSTGRVRYWADIGSREKNPEESVSNKSRNLYYPLMEKPISQIETEVGTVMPSFAITNTVPTISLTQRAAYYEFDGTTPATVERIGLDANILLGYLRVIDDVSHDQLGEVTNLMIRSLSKDNTFVGSEFNITPASGLNLNRSESPVNFLLEDENYVNHGLSVIGTIDGKTLFDIATPSLVSYSQGVRHYSCSVLGVWHMIKMTADNVGESFHPVTFELVAVSAGRLG